VIADVDAAVVVDAVALMAHPAAVVVDAVALMAHLAAAEAFVVVVEAPWAYLGKSTSLS
jgi:hypothetical protein